MTVAQAIDVLSPEERLELYELLQIADRRKRENALAAYKPYAKQVAFHAAGASFRERLFMAGNQLGKTLSGGAEVAMHLTGRYPDWWPGKRIANANRWIAGSESAELTRKGVQRMLFGPPEIESEWGTGMIPKKCILDISRRQGITDAIASAVIRHEPTGDVSTIQLQSYEQGRNKWQADTVDGVWCIAEGQRVMMADGRYLPIERVKPGDWVLSADDRGRRIAARVTAVHDQGIKDTVDVRAKRGPWMRMTPDHKVFRTTRQRVPVAKAERVLQAQITGWEPPSPSGRSHAWLAWTALVAAEGTVSARKLTMADGPAVQAAIAALPPDARVRRKDFAEHTKHVPDWHLYWPDFWEQVAPALAHEKRLPDWVFHLPNDDVAVLLGYLWAGDGWLSGKQAGYATTSRALAEEVSVLLWRLGVRSGVDFRESKNPNWRDQWHVRITSAPHVLRFLDHVRVPGKEAAAEAVRLEAQRRMRTRRQDSPERERFAAITHRRPAGLARVYDLTVEGTHRFALGTAIVSNCDEEPPLDLYSEAITRTNVTQGPVIVTFTPLLGMSDVVKRFLVDKQAGSMVVNMTIEDVTHYTPEQREAIIAAYPEHEREARAKGIPMMGSGRVFPIIESAIKCEAFAIPAHWPRIVGIDFGVDHPAAIVWLAWDRDTDTLYVYDCWRERSRTPAEQALVYRPRGAWIPAAWPHDGLQRDKGSGIQLAKQYAAAGVSMLPERATFEDGSNGLEAGVAEMLQRMQSRRLRVFSHLNDWFEEFRMYHRKDGIIVPLMDDLLSATRYAMMMRRFAKTQSEAQGNPFALIQPTGMGRPLDDVIGY